MLIFKCKMCGGNLEIADNQGVATCEYCGTKQTLPKVDDETITNLFNRANRLRMHSEFDKAEEVYEKIINLDDTEAEAHWGIVLCKYGIEYVEDPVTYKRIPTCHRASYESVIEDNDYKAAIANADSIRKELYELEAKRIDAVQKDILRIVSNEKPFDVFICYKETDATGERTKDSVLAQDVYEELTDKGLRVFFARITLEDKLGTEYEPYIFAALNSAKVMLVIGTKNEHLEAVWVKNEWSRFLKLMKNDRSKNLIPCYVDMDPYDMPEALSHLQAQNLGKVGAMQDLVRGVRKLITSEIINNDSKFSSAEEQLIESLTNKAYDFIKLGDIKSANITLDNLYTYDSNNANYYVGRLLIKRNLTTIEQLADENNPFDKDEDFLNALKCAKKEFKTILLNYKDTQLYNYCFKIFKEERNINNLKNAISMTQRINVLESKEIEDKVATLVEDIENKIKKIKKNIKKTYKISSIVAICLAIVSLVVYYFLPSTQYKIGIDVLRKGDYKKAYNYLKDIDYIDSKDLTKALVLLLDNEIEERVTLKDIKHMYLAMKKIDYYENDIFEILSYKSDVEIEDSGENINVG